MVPKPRKSSEELRSEVFAVGYTKTYANGREAIDELGVRARGGNKYAQDALSNLSNSPHIKTELRQRAKEQQK